MGARLDFIFFLHLTTFLILLDAICISLDYPHYVHLQTLAGNSLESRLDFERYLPVLGRYMTLLINSGFL